MISEANLGYFGNRRPDLVNFMHKCLDVAACTPHRLLEVGCGTGANCDLYREMGIGVVDGIELRGDVAAIAQTRFDHVWNMPVEDFVLNDPPYDAVILADVIEHLVDPWAVLDKMRTWTREKGVLVSSIPNVQNRAVIWPLLKGQWDYAPSGILDRTHLRFFTKSSARQLFDSTGWTIIAESRNPQSFKGQVASHLTLRLFDNFMALQFYFGAVKKS